MKYTIERQWIMNYATESNDERKHAKKPLKSFYRELHAKSFGTKDKNR